MNENYEVETMETMEEETQEVAVCDQYMEDETKSGGAGVAAAVVAGVLALGGLAIVGVKKLKAKNADKPKKPKTKLRLVKMIVDEDGNETLYVPEGTEVIEAADVDAEEN